MSAETKPAAARGFPGWPDYATDEVAAVQRVLQSGRVNYWTGNECRAFEAEFARYSGTAYGIALANGTVALELALRCLDIGAGDEVIVTPRTFIASASSIVLCGATPVFADIDPDSQNVTADTIQPLLTSRTRAIVAVHLAGWPCDMDGILALAREHGLRVIEDCAQAHGARYKGRLIGSFGDMAAFSFCQDKIMTTGGEGGMLLTNCESLWKRAWAYKDHGKDYDAVFNRPQPTRPVFRWLHESFGSNWRMTEMQAAIGRIQLGKLEGWVARRQENARILLGRLARIPALRVPVPGPDIGHAYYKGYTFVRPQLLRSGWDRDRIIAELNAAGVPCFSGSCSEVYREKAFRDAGLAPAVRLRVARELGETSMMFPVHPTLDAGEMERMAAVVEKVMAAAQP